MKMSQELGNERICIKKKEPRYIKISIKARSVLINIPSTLPPALTGTSAGAVREGGLYPHLSAGV